MSRFFRFMAVVLMVLPFAVLWQTLEGVVASTAWVIVLAISRAAASRTSAAERGSLDALALMICLIGFFVGGLYWAPAALAFWLADRSTGSEAGPALRPLRFLDRGSGAALGLAACLAGWVGIAAFLFLPLYTTAQTSATPVGGVSTSTASSATVLQVGLGPYGSVTIALMALLFLAIAVGSIVRDRAPVAGPVLLITALGLTAIASLGILTIGIFVLPGLLLAWVTVIGPYWSRQRLARR